MTFKEAALIVMDEEFAGNNFITQENASALADHTAFLDGIPDDDKEKIAGKLFWEIYSFEGEQFKNWTVAPPTAKPVRVIESDLQTVNDFLGLLEKIYLDVPSMILYMGGRRLSGGKEAEQYIAAKKYAEKLKHDLEILQTGVAKCNQSDLLLLKKGRYYSKAISKEDIKKTVIQILKDYSLPLHTTDRRRVYDEFIARLHIKKYKKGTFFCRDNTPPINR